MMTTALITFACPHCGETVEAVASASVAHHCPKNHNRTTTLKAKP